MRAKFLTLNGRLTPEMRRSVPGLLLMLFVVGTGVMTCLAGEGPAAAVPPPAAVGRTLFLKNCAHCHADDATGDEGPDLHGLTKSDDWISRRIRNGIKGEMTAFGEKFSSAEVSDLIAFLRTLK